MSWFTNSLKVYAETASVENTRILSNSDYTSNVGRTDGALPNTAISSTLMNTCLKSTTSFMKGMLDALNTVSSGTSVTIDNASTDAAFQAFFEQALPKVVVEKAAELNSTTTFTIKDYANISSSVTVTLPGDVTITLPAEITFHTVTASVFTGNLEGTADSAKTLTGFSELGSTSVPNGDGQVGIDYFPCSALIDMNNGDVIQVSMSFHDNHLGRNWVNFPLMTLRRQSLSHQPSINTLHTMYYSRSNLYYDFVLIYSTSPETVSTDKKVQVFCRKNGGSWLTFNTTNFSELSSQPTLYYKKIG